MRYYRNQGLNPPVMVREIAKRSTSQVVGVIPFGDATEDLVEDTQSSPSENDRLIEAVSVIDVLPVVYSRRGARIQRLSHTFDLDDLRSDDHWMYYRHDGLRALSGTVPLGAAERRFNYGDGSVLVLTGGVNYRAVEIAGASSNLPTIRPWTPPSGETGYSASANLAITGKGTGKVQVTNLEIASGPILSNLFSSMTIDVYSTADTTLRVRNSHVDYVADLDVEGDVIVGGELTVTGDMAVHDHEAAAGGGQLDHTAALTNVGTNTHAQLDSLAKFFQGTFLESFDALVIEDTGAVKMTLEQAGGGDLTMVFSDGYTTLDCTPIINITLTEGADAANPKTNYVYVLQSGKILALSTTGWPDAEHIKVGFFLIQTDIEVAARGALINQNWNDHAVDTAGADVGQGHLTHITERTRRLGAVWLNGCEGVATQDGNDLWVSIASGEVSQMHPHSFAALDSDTAGAGDDVLVVNDPDAAYTVIHSFNEITKLADGSAIGNNKFVKFVLWAVANKSGELSPMMLNLPTDEYNTTVAAATDVQGYANFAIPAEFNLESTTGFLIAAFVCKHTASAMELQSTIDQRGKTPSTATGAGTGGGDVTAAAVLTDNAIIRGDGGAKGVQDSGVIISDADAMSGLTQMDVDNLRLDGNTLSATGGTNLFIEPYLTNSVQVNVDGTATAEKIAILMTNSAWNASMVDTRTAFAFYQAINSGGTLGVSGEIVVGTETNWAASPLSTQDAYMALCTTLDGICTEKVRVTSDGMVGIGTADPGATFGSRLSIHNEGRCSISLFTFSNIDTTDSRLFACRARGTETSEVVVEDDDVLFLFQALGWAPSGAFRTAAYIKIDVDGTPATTTVPGAISFWTTTTSSPSLRMTIQSDGDILVDSGSSVFVRDSGLGFNSSVDGQLDLFADTECEITAPTVDLTAATAVIVRNVHGINYAPGSDIDCDLVTVDVTGGPKLWWDESENAFAVTHRLIASVGVQTKYATDDVADPPTDAELDAAFGDPTVVGSGFVGILDDNDLGTDCYVCWTTGAAGEWFYVKGTKAV